MPTKRLTNTDKSTGDSVKNCILLQLNVATYKHRIARSVVIPFIAFHSADFIEKTPEPWHLQRPAGENRIDILLKHEQENQGSQTPRAVDGTRLKIWDDSDLHFNKTM